jgi:hypothetical protein
MWFSYRLVRHCHLEAAFCQRLELKPSVSEHRYYALFSLLPRSHDILFDAIDGPLGDGGSPRKLGLAPAQHGPRRPDTRSKQRALMFVGM